MCGGGHGRGGAVASEEGRGYTVKAPVRATECGRTVKKKRGKKGEEKKRITH
jgi:hypothetical protein